jgi:hypothetical protein
MSMRHELDVLGAKRRQAICCSTRRGLRNLRISHSDGASKQYGRDERRSGNIERKAAATATATTDHASTSADESATTTRTG